MASASSDWASPRNENGIVKTRPAPLLKDSFPATLRPRQYLMVSGSSFASAMQLPGRHRRQVRSIPDSSFSSAAMCTMLGRAIVRRKDDRDPHRVARREAPYADLRDRRGLALHLNDLSSLANSNRLVALPGSLASHDPVAEARGGRGRLVGDRRLSGGRSRGRLCRLRPPVRAEPGTGHNRCEGRNSGKDVRAGGQRGASAIMVP